MLRRGQYRESFFNLMRDHFSLTDLKESGNHFFLLRHSSSCPLHSAYKLGAQLGVNETQIYINERGHWIAFYTHYQKRYILWTGNVKQWTPNETLLTNALTTIETLKR